ncbi:hypothetical protein [Thermoanaerobacterium sp. RBIITD]|uniref:TTE1925 family mutarotase n=1 Tax=Thermoanaerobacterium sp. RBIITD TaxID=1550240 RepID=UPI000BB816E8|nr:hypothetical protein [Thermoanaerobacterium sp. RBIITD]SNX55291.1 hypothetical protein SAMN05660242_3113 [Thermoanaerobacterium sp. RBIITD]
MSVNIKKITYSGWNNCIEVSNGIVDIVATTEIGPRIIRFGFIGDVNEFSVNSEDAGKKGENIWRNYGGHRLWHSPEAMPRTYSLDNFPIDYKELENGIKLIQKSDSWVNMQKEIEITLDPDKPKVKVLHKITNKGAWPVELSPWSISVMATGGLQVVQQPDKDTGLLPNRALVLWPYSKMNDHRIHWGEKYIIFEQDVNTKEPFKFGIQNENGWAAYFNHNHLFVKHFKHDENATYPDYNASYETYTTDWMMEMESLGPMVKLEPEASTSHVEEWELFDNVKRPSIDEKEIDELIKFYIK